MKKLLVVLLALTLFGVFAFAQDDAATFPATTVGGSFIWFSNYDGNAVTSGPNQARIAFTTKLDANNTVYMSFRAEGGVANWNGYTLPSVKLRNAKLTTDVTGALGIALPVTVKLTTGYFDTYFTNWGYADDAGYAFYYEWPNGLVNGGLNTSGAFQLDLGAGPVNFHYFNDMAFDSLLVGADSAVGPVSFWAAYGATGMDADKENVGKGSLSLEAKYALDAGDLKLAAYPYFRYALGAAGFLPAEGDFVAGLGVGVDYTMLHVGLGADLDNFSKLDTTGLSHVVVQASVAPIAAAKVGVNAYLKMYEDNALQGIDIYGQYKFGVATVQAGYIVGGTDKNAIPLYGDNPSAANGLYALIAVSF
jgi:hypothetical protein